MFGSVPGSVTPTADPSPGDKASRLRVAVPSADTPDDNQTPDPNPESTEPGSQPTSLLDRDLNHKNAPIMNPTPIRRSLSRRFSPPWAQRVAMLALAGLATVGVAPSLAQPIPEEPSGQTPTPQPPSGTPMPISPAPEKPDTSPGSPGAAAQSQAEADKIKEKAEKGEPIAPPKGEGRGVLNPSGGARDGRAVAAPGVRPAPSRGRPDAAAADPKANPNAGLKNQFQPNTNPNNNPKTNAAQAPNTAISRGQMPDLNDGEMITLASFSEPIDLRTLVDLVARTLNINVTTLGELQGSVVFNAPVEVPRSELLGLLESLLEQNNYTLTYDRQTGWYTVQPSSAVTVNFEGDRATTRIFRTPNMRPSALKQPIEFQLGSVGGGANPNAGGQGRQYAYVDDLGVIIATDSPKRLAMIEDLINRLVEEYNKAKFIRLEVLHIAAPVARERALQFIGVTQQPVSGVNAVNVSPGGNPGGVSRLENMGERLTVDPQGNALIFRGIPEEIATVREVLNVIDVPNTLKPRQYFAGAAAAQIAGLARDRGMGEITIFAADAQNQGQNFDPRTQNRNVAGFNNQVTSTTGGSVMVVDTERGNILYYATDAQHAQMDQLIKELDTQSEIVVIKAYKLNHQKAEDVSQIILGLLNNSTPAGEAPLLPGGGGSSPRFNNAAANRTTRSFRGSGQDEDGLSLDGTDSFVIADPGNNQIIVKAPTGQQQDFRRLIETLDLRKSQVYIEAKIVAVTADDSMRLAFETQLINANGTGGLLNTNFGLSSFASAASILDPKLVATGLPGLTAAVIKSDQIPIIMTALANTTDTRIVSTPQLLVDDNEESTVVSVEEQPFTQTTQTSGNPTQTSFAGYAEAGTTLTVTPQISPGGYLRLDYDIELSSFTGDSPGAGVPPPRLTNNVTGNVTVPSDFTVIVGGLVVDTTRKTVVKVPFIGDIPLVGLLFRDTRDSDRKTTLYIFLTPRILNEPTFEDLLLLSRGPQWKMLQERDVPELMPVAIEVAPAPRKDSSFPWRESPAAPTLNPQPIQPSRPSAPVPGEPQPLRPTTPPDDARGPAGEPISPTMDLSDQMNAGMDFQPIPIPDDKADADPNADPAADGDTR